MNIFHSSKKIENKKITQARIQVVDVDNMASGVEVAAVALEEGALPCQRAGVGLNRAAGASSAVIVDAAIFGSSSGSELADGAADRVFVFFFCFFSKLGSSLKPKQEELNGTWPADPPAAMFARYDLTRFSLWELVTFKHQSDTNPTFDSVDFGTFC